MGENGEKNSGLRALPSLDELISLGEMSEAVNELGHSRVVSMLREAIAGRRAELAAANGDGAAFSRTSLTQDILDRFRSARESESLAGVSRVINATGVVVHTNLGRSPLSDAAVQAMSNAAGYASIEYDLEEGRRGPRGPRAVSLLKTVTGAEDALVVNNCAAAALLVLSVFARGGEVIVSRGELVEIGGDFRIPDVLTRSGAVLREVGTTNRTHLRDYEAAISSNTSMILKVHPSNYRIMGFTRSVGTEDLAGLAQKNGAIFFEDAGSGALVDLEPYGVKGEPVIGSLIAAGADLVSFSGDKLLGGPQCGLIVGKPDLVEQLRRNPLYRALRVDKTTTAGLEATLESYARGRAMEEIPTLKSIRLSKAGIRPRAEAMVERLSGKTASSGLAAGLVDGVSAVGGGASPDAVLETVLIALSHREMDEAELERKLRRGRSPVIARIESGRVIIDLRTVRENEEDELLEMIVEAAGA